MADGRHAQYRARMSARPLTGRCLCGQVTYRCDAEPLGSAICHCTDCQRQTGAPFSLALVVPRTALEITGDSVARFETINEVNGKPRERLFCSNCGSPIVSLPSELPDVAALKAGTLDEPVVDQPKFEIWCRSKQPWLELGGPERTRFETVPEG